MDKLTTLIFLTVVLFSCVTDDKEMVKNCFELFFNREFDKLEKKIRVLEEYGQMEAQN